MMLVIECIMTLLYNNYHNAGSVNNLLSVNVDVISQTVNATIHSGYRAGNNSYILKYGKDSFYQNLPNFAIETVRMQQWVVFSLGTLEEKETYYFELTCAVTTTDGSEVRDVAVQGHFNTSKYIDY